MKLKIGSPVTKENFYPRTDIRGRLVRALKRDMVTFLGPRRTGKTSILLDLRDNPPEGTLPIFIDIQQLNNIPDWLSLMISETKKALNIASKRKDFLKLSKKKIGNFLQRIESISILDAGIKLGKGDQATQQWKKEADEFSTLVIESEIPIYYMLDEFPWFLGNVAKNHTPAEAQAFLDWFRSLRLSLTDHATSFLLTGSIGLNGLLRRLELSSTVNDLDSVEIRPINETEADEFIQALAKGEEINISKSARKSILECLGVAWPILLQNFVSEIQEFGSHRKTGPTKADIQQIYEQELVRGNRNKYCHEMFTRIKKLDFFNQSERALAERILKELSQNKDSLGNDEIKNIHSDLIPEEMHRSVLEDELDYVIETLLHDGYLIRDNEGKYQFSSNVMKDYWMHRIA